jgi:hypothetical protein
MNTEQISLIKVGSYLMPDGGSTTSSIKVVEVQEKGFRFRRCHSYHNGEEFFLSKEALCKSQWVLIPIGTQLILF